jgi:adenylate cyclase
MPFDQIQCADLRSWSGDETPGWRKLAASVLALAGAAQKEDMRRSKRQEISICVLPFANMSGDAEQEYFSDGISEDITTDLSKVSALAVTARNTAFTYKGKSVNMCDVARDLSVGHVLEGSVRKAGGRVRITAQLIDGATGDHVWAERYDRDLTDIFAIQDEISKAIVDALKVKLLPEEKKVFAQRGTENAEAYSLFLMARNYWITGNFGDRRREETVIRICRKAIELDPNYADAWALLASAESGLRFGFGETNVDALASAEQALAINPDLGEARLVRVRYLAAEGRDAEATAEAEAAVALSPDSWEANKELGRRYLTQRRFHDAIRYYEKTVAIAENDFHTWAQLDCCYAAVGDQTGVDRALSMLVSQTERVLKEDPNNAAALGFGAGALCGLGDMDRSQEWIRRAILIDPDNFSVRYNYACSLAKSRRFEEALDYLEPSFATGGPRMVRFAAVDPDLDCLRGGPRFDAMLAGALQRLGIVAAV